MTPHPHPLPADELEACQLAYQEFYRVNDRHNPLSTRLKNITVPRSVFEKIQSAFSHFPQWVRLDEHGVPVWEDQPGEWTPVVLNVCFIKSEEPREHIVFKGVCCFPGDDHEPLPQS